MVQISFQHYLFYEAVQINFAVALSVYLATKQSLYLPNLDMWWIRLDVYFEHVKKKRKIDKKDN